MKFIKLFNQHAEYEAYINGSDKVLPNISYCEDLNDTHFNPLIILPNNVIYYESTEMLPEGGIGPNGPKRGYNPNAFGTTLVSHVFENGKGQLIFENDIETFGSYAFYSCDKMTSIIIPNTVTSINGLAFIGCTGFPVENDMRYADNVLIDVTDKTKTSYTIKNGTKCIGTNVFYNCTNLMNITIPNTVVTIGAQAFQACSSLTNITIPNNVVSIENSAFNGCSGLTSITIPSSVTSIGQSVFYNCSGLTSITILATIPPTASYSNMFHGNYPIYVPAESVEAYKTATYWSTYASRIQAIQ